MNDTKKPVGELINMFSDQLVGAPMGASSTMGGGIRAPVSGNVKAMANMFDKQNDFGVTRAKA